MNIFVLATRRRLLVSDVRMKKLTNSLGGTFSLRQYWPLWTFLLLLGAVDISNRFVGKLDYQAADEYLAKPRAMREIPVLSVEMLKQYMEKLGEHTEQKEPEPIDSSLKDVFEESQGLGFWSGADHRFQLFAIFIAADKVAVLRRSDLETGESDIVEVREGDLMGDFVVSRISKHTLSLTGPEKEQADLMLFRPLQDLSEGAGSTNED
jgi:hypothetical protein